MLNKKGQQEMIGFILIVALVVIAMLVFLIISIKKPNNVEDSIEVENLLSSVMSYTTECAIGSEPDYDSVRDLIVSCHKNDECSNTGKMACETLNQTLLDIMESLMKTEAGFSAYQIKVFDKEVGESDGKMFDLFEGSCNGSVVGTQMKIRSGSSNLAVNLDICY